MQTAKKLVAGFRNIDNLLWLRNSNRMQYEPQEYNKLHYSIKWNLEFSNGKSEASGEWKWTLR